ncbi:MAG: VacJ family lipoprotein [Alphaproteobacteria bacterium]|nr:VacJ family lipoprotein [Alphaproteobacteria bacterium]
MRYARIATLKSPTQIHNPKLSRLLYSATAMAFALLAGCSTMPSDAEGQKEFREANDPVEPLNRYFFDVNLFLDKLILKPVTQVYLELPEGPRNGVTNFLRNLHSPVILANDLLQGKLERAGTTASRFGINTTLGVGGIFDLATDAGIERHHEDFGQTLGFWGAGEGPYLVLPILGPAPPRDLAGKVVDYFIDPLTWVARNSDWEWFGPARYSTELIDFRARNFDEIDKVEREAVDLYARVRSAYRQSRIDDIRDGKSGPLVPVPRISINDETPRKVSQGY